MMLMKKGKSGRTLIYNHPIKISVNLLRANKYKVMAGKLGSFLERQLGSFLVGLSLLLNRVKQKRVSRGKGKNNKAKGKTKTKTKNKN